MSKSSGKTKAEIKRIRKRRKMIVGGVIFAMAAIIALTVLAFIFCRVETISIKGETPYSQDEIRNMLSQSAGRSMFTVDTEGLAEYVETVLPYTDNVTITKKFPKTLSVKAETAKKTFAVELSGRVFAVTNEDLKMLEAASAVPSGVIPVECSGIATYEMGKPLNFSAKVGEDPTKTVLTEIYASAENEEFKNISVINVSDLNAIYFIYDGRILVRLGDTGNISKKISLAKKSIDEENKLSPAQYGVLDLSISKKAVFSPDDMEDIPEITAFLEKADEIIAPPETATGSDAQENPDSAATGTSAQEEASITDTNPA